MRFLLFLTLFVSSAYAEFTLRGSNETYHWKEFTFFQQKFGKTYSSLEELETRFAIFRSNLIDILNHNNGEHNVSFTLGVNQFSDLTNQEFRELYTAPGIEPLGSYGCKSFSSTASGAPNNVDWRTKGVVNSVRDQGQCGSCWAFATTANAESVWAISSGKLLDLSEEFLVDCASGVGYFNLGCNGGQPDSAFKYMINNGQCYETNYPYKAGTTKTAGTCQTCNPAPVHFSACYDVASNNQVALMNAVAKQPVAVAIDAGTRYFQSYSGGILDSTACGNELNHAVEIVGYGSENGVDYWIVRNSWSSSWGEQGYVRIKKSSSTNDEGICGIASQPSFLAV